MVTTSKVSTDLLETLANYVFNNYRHMSVGTGTTALSGGETVLPNAVQIGISDFNKILETGTTGSSLSGRTALYKFKLTSGEPNTLPVNIGNVGLVDNSGNGSKLAVGGVFATTATKDNLSQWVIRAEVKIRRIDE